MPRQWPKSIEEDPRAQKRIEAILESPSYRQADQDVDLLSRDDLRGVRLQLDYLKPWNLIQQHKIRHTIVVFGGTRIRETTAIRREMEELQILLAAKPADPDLVHRLAVAERLQAKSHYYDVAREFGRLVSNCPPIPRTMTWW